MFMTSISIWSYKKQHIIWCSCIVHLIVLFQYADLVFPGFFFSLYICFYLKCFFYLLDINVLPFLIRVVQVWKFFLWWLIPSYELKTGRLGACGRLLFILVLASHGSSPFSNDSSPFPGIYKWYLYLEYNATFPVDARFHRSSREDD